MWGRRRRLPANRLYNKNNLKVYVPMTSYNRSTRHPWLSIVFFFFFALLRDALRK